MAEESERLVRLYDDATGESELLRAIKLNELVVHYQPVVRVYTRQVIGVEALVRWQHPRRGLIPPDAFIPLAERNGSITSLTSWVLKTALEQCSQWLKGGLHLFVSVNLSARDLSNSSLPQMIAAALDDVEVAPSWLQVEITETAMTPDSTPVLKWLNTLRQLGVRVAIDDFGAGYSSLVRLKRLPADALKIDRSLIADIARDQRNLAIARSVVELGHRLGLQVVAEGVEDHTTYVLLEALGCDVVQGYYVGRPLEAEAFVAWIRHAKWSLPLSDHGEAVVQNLPCDP